MTPSGSGSSKARPPAPGLLCRVLVARLAAELPTGIVMPVSDVERRTGRVVLRGRVIREAEAD